MNVINQLFSKDPMARDPGVKHQDDNLSSLVILESRRSPSFAWITEPLMQDLRNKLTHP